MTTIELVPAELNFRFVRGDDFTATLNFKDESDVVVDLSNSSFDAQVRRKTSSEPPVSFTIDTSDSVGGVLILDLNRSVTQDLLHSYVWDLQRTYTSDGRVETIFSGKITIEPDATRL